MDEEEAKVEAEKAAEVEAAKVEAGPNQAMAAIAKAEEEFDT